MTTKPSSSIFDSKILLQALWDAFRKFDPRTQWQHPIIFVVFIGSIVSTICTILHTNAFRVQLTLWLWITVIFSNYAEALAEGRGKSQATALRSTRTQSFARRVKDDSEEKVPAMELKIGDRVICESNDIIPGDGDVIEGIASVDESAITGESAPVIRESGGDRSAVTGGTRVLSDRIVIRITSEQGNTFIDRMIAMVEGARRQKTPNEIALSILLNGMTLLFLIVVITLPFFCQYSMNAELNKSVLDLSLPTMIAILVCLIPTTIGGLLSAIGISGIDRLIQRNVLATSGRAVEAAGNIDVLLLDKTGTITLGNRIASNFVPASNVAIEEVASIAQLASLADETPEGRSIVVLAKDLFDIRVRDLTHPHVKFIPFTAQTRMSGVDMLDHEGKIIKSIRKGAAESIKNFVESQGGIYSSEIANAVDAISQSGGTPLVIAEGRDVIGVIHLKDVVKHGIKERFAQLREMGIRTVMVTGDNAITAAAIAAEAGVDDFIANATPEQKLQRIRKEQDEGRLVAMTGDGTNDAPALAQADVGVAMNTGTQSAREAGNMIDLDSNPTKLIEIVETGKMMLMTRGALTTFSIANDVAKYFAILPAMFSGLYAFSPHAYGPLKALDIMNLHSLSSAILSAVIFNALIIVMLIPLAIKGIHYRPLPASKVLMSNVMIYGLGGVLAPFVGIKLIDLALVAMHLV